MAVGPLELLILSFPHERLGAGVRATIGRLADRVDLRIVDALVLRPDPAGQVSTAELYEMGGPDPSQLTDLALFATGLIAATDVREAAARLAGGTGALLVLLEHHWMRELAGTIAPAGGTVVALNHIPGAPGRARPGGHVPPRAVPVRTRPPTPIGRAALR